MSQPRRSRCCAFSRRSCPPASHRCAATRSARTAASWRAGCRNWRSFSSIAISTSSRSRNWRGAGRRRWRDRSRRKVSTRRWLTFTNRSASCSTTARTSFALDGRRAPYARGRPPRPRTPAKLRSLLARCRHRRDVVIRVAVDPLVERIDAGKRRLAVDRHLYGLGSTLHRAPLEIQHGGGREVALARLGGKDADVKRLVQRRLDFVAAAVGVELARFDREGDLEAARSEE